MKVLNHLRYRQSWSGGDSDHSQAPMRRGRTIEEGEEISPFLDEV